MNLFDNIREVQEITEEWLQKYNRVRPHQSLANLTTWEFAEKIMGGSQLKTVLKMGS